MHNKKIALISTFIVMICLLGCVKISIKASSNNGYTPTYTIFKSDDMENLDIPTETPLATANYVWEKSSLLWAETNNVTTITDTKYVMEGSKSIKWMPGAGDSTGWTASNVGIGISPSKMLGSSGGYLIKLELLLYLENTEKLVIKAFDSDNKLRQECIIDKNYEDASDDKTIDSDEETSLEIEKRTKDDSSLNYCKLSFTFRSSVNFTTYFTFVAQATNENCSVYLDDINVYKENKPDIPYRNYQMLLEDKFEYTDVDASIFKENKVNVKTIALNNENPIEGLHDLKLTSAVRNQKTTINSSKITLNSNYYKLYFKVKCNYAIKIGISVHDYSTQEIIYDFIINPVTSERLTTSVNTLFDSSNFYINSDQIWTCYGEFNLEEQKDVYLSINMTLSNLNGYGQFDEITLLEEYEHGSYPDSYNNDPQKVEGVLEASYKNLDESNYLRESIRSLFRDKNVFDYMLIIGIAFFVLFVSISIVILKDKKVIRNRTRILLLALLVSFSFLCVGCSNGNDNDVVKGYNVVNPQKISGKLDNPGMGWVILEEPTYGGHIDVGSSGTFPEVNNISLSTSWKHIEIDEGVYDFTLCDKAVDYWVSQGKRINLRICTDSLVLPYTYNGCPDYLFEKYNVGYQVVDYFDPGPVRSCRTTDIRDKNYLYFLDKFLNELYNHYKDNKKVDVVEIRGFGLWGEWHHGMTFTSKADRISSLYNIFNYY